MIECWQHDFQPYASTENYQCTMCKLWSTPQYAEGYRKGVADGIARAPRPFSARESVDAVQWASTVRALEHYRGTVQQQERQIAQLQQLHKVYRLELVDVQDKLANVKAELRDLRDVGLQLEHYRGRVRRLETELAEMQQLHKACRLELGDVQDDLIDTREQLRQYTRFMGLARESSD
jgi:chromosome segregation ATPase